MDGKGGFLDHFTHCPWLLWGHYIYSPKTSGYGPLCPDNEGGEGLVWAWLAITVKSHGEGLHWPPWTPFPSEAAHSAGWRSHNDPSPLNVLPFKDHPTSRRDAVCLTLSFSFRISEGIRQSALAIRGTMLTFSCKAFMNSTSTGLSLQWTWGVAAISKETQELTSLSK